MNSRLRRLAMWMTLVSVLVAVLATPLTYLGFKLNQDYLARTQCEFREISITVCAGSCVLEKRLKMVTHDSSPQAIPIQVVLNMPLFFQQLSTFQAHQQSGFSHPLVPENVSRPIGFVFSLFRPPQ